jgi:hypothetical protein
MGYEEALNQLHIHAKLVVELNMDSIRVKFGRQEDDDLFVEFAWSAAAMAQFDAERVAPKHINKYFSKWPKDTCRHMGAP